MGGRVRSSDGNVRACKRFDMICRNTYKKSMKSAVSAKGQVTIPKKLRDRLGIRPGAVLEFREERGRLVASKARVASPTDRVYGILKLRGPTDALVRALRGKADAV